jgi:ABC-type Zn uptake system ZnuABC Zn-binding protein ZnuA
MTDPARPGDRRPALGMSLLVAVAALAFAGCSTAPSTSAVPGVSVVVTTTVLADLVRQVGGDRVAVTSLVPKGGEVHTFDPTPSLVRQVADADLLVMNGLGLDEWLRNLAADSGSGATVLVLGEDLPDADYIAGGDGEASNPHLWLDVTYAEAYVERIRAALEAIDAPGSGTYESNAEAYLGRLRDLDRFATTTMEAIPPSQRRVIAFHDALPYFARAYGLDIVGVVVPAPGQDPSAGYVASLVDEIRRTGARAILSEVQFSPALAQAIANETGIKLVGQFYDDTLGDPPVDTYEGLMRWDVQQLADALR